MAVIANERDERLQAAPQRTQPVTLPPGTSINPGQINPGPLPPGVTTDVDQVIGAGALAKQDYLNLATQVTGQLAHGNVGGLGALALLNQINLATQTVGTLDANTQVVNLGQLAYANSLAADQIGAGTLAAGIIYAGGIQAHQVDSRGLTIRTPDGQIVLDASRRLQVQDLTDAGVFATLNAISLGDPRLTGFGGLAGADAVALGTAQVTGNLPNAQVSGLGALALQSTVSLTNQVTGALARTSVSGLGALAALNVVNLSTQTTGALNGQTQVTNLGNLAYANSIAANQIGAGTLAAGVVYAGVINASQVNSGTFTGLTFQTSAAGSSNRVLIAASDNSLRVTIGGNERVRIGGNSIGSAYIVASAALVPAIYATSETTGVAAIWGSTAATGASGVYGTATGGGNANGVLGTSGGTGVGVAAQGSSNSTLNHAFRGRQITRFSAGLVGAANGYSFYAEEGSGYGPFTGAHDGLLRNELLASLVIGDIVVDKRVITRRGVSDVLTEVEPSSTACERGAVGVYCNVQGPVSQCEPAAMIRGDTVDETGARTRVCRTRSECAETHTLITMNSVGEGQINVCGEGGDIAIGDLIVCSSMPGKGMRQADDLVRSYTVAKARETINFDGPGDLRLVACIYLCG